MLPFIARRLVSGIFLVLVISAVTFGLLYFSSQNIALNILGDTATIDQIEAKKAELGLDRPIVERYFDWLGAAVTGDLGTSWFTSENIFSTLLLRLPVTLTLVVVTILLAAIIATALGMVAAVKGGVIDRIVQVLGVIGFAVPGFVLAIFLIVVFAISFLLFPATGWVPIEQDPSLWLQSLVLPVTALLVGTVASSAQQFRSAMKSVLERDWVKTLRSRGLPEREILLKHVLRASAPAGLTILSLQFVGMLGGAVIIEQIFALPGIGFLALQSTSVGDTPVVMGVVVVTVIIVVLVNLFVDLLNGWLNPKVRVK
jgi:peptide/nickel transport system permease protein